VSRTQRMGSRRHGAQRTVHILGVAARTPVGYGASDTAAAIRAGISRVNQDPFLIAADGEHLRCARVPELDPRLRGTARLVALARFALAEISAGWPEEQATDIRVPLLLALPEERPGFGDREVRAVMHALEGFEMSAHAAVDARVTGRGHAGGLRGLTEAFDLIARGRQPICIIGGVDSYFDGDTIDWLDAGRRLARDGVRGGFPPGEAAAMILVASGQVLRQLGCDSLGIIRAVGYQRDRGRGRGASREFQPERDFVTDETSPSDEPLGKTLTQVYRRVLREVKSPDEKVDDLYCDINDERDRTTEYAFALLRAGQAFQDGTRYTTAVSMVGDVGAATATLNCVLAVRAWSRDYATGPLAFISGRSWSGLCGAALLQREA
jgi:3-oxoacyl-[acyl-carrier-protein] synthase-1